MRKGYLLSALTLLLIALVTLTQAAEAQLKAGVQLGFGNASYSQILKNNAGAKSAQLVNSVGVQYDHEDLRFTVFYQGTLPLGSKSISRHGGQASANFRVFEEGPMQVYAGLGYHLAYLNFQGSLGQLDKPFSFTGHGFAGQVLVDIELSPGLRTSAIVSISPWMKWAFRNDKESTSKIDSRAAFSAKLDFVYDFSEQMSLQVGIAGGGHKVPAFEFGGETLGETKGSFSTISVGVTQRF